VAHFSVTEAIPVQKAERKVEKETALALISDRELEQALAKVGDQTEWEIAEELGVTMDVLRLRIFKCLKSASGNGCGGVCDLKWVRIYFK